MGVSHTTSAGMMICGAWGISRAEGKLGEGGEKSHLRAVECRTVFETISSSANYSTFMA